MKINNTAIHIVKGDITELKADAIVNPANMELTMKRGLAQAIRARAGIVVEEESLLHTPVKPGEVFMTKAGHMPAKYVIHAIISDEEGETDQHILREAVKNVLLSANDKNLKSIGLPALGCGLGNFSKRGAAKIMTQEIAKFCRRADCHLKDITFSLYDSDTYKEFNHHVKGYLTHLKETLGIEPYVTVDIIIEVGDGIVLIERSNPPFGWALPGGFLDAGESLEEAAVREAKEETNLDLEDLKQFHTYSDPNRDPRFHTISTVFIAKGKGNPQSGDDAQDLRIVKRDDLLKEEYAFDHSQVIEDYLSR